MSYHDIGIALNTVVKQVIRLLDEEKISTEAAREIIVACRRGVHWCDGNEDEAVESIRRNRCGWCLNKIPKGLPLYSLWTLLSFQPDYPFREEDPLMCKGVELALDGLCEECFEAVVGKNCKEGFDTARVKKLIIDRSEPEEYLSEGEMPVDVYELLYGKMK